MAFGQQDAAARLEGQGLLDIARLYALMTHLYTTVLDIVVGFEQPRRLGLHLSYQH